MQVSAEISGKTFGQTSFSDFRDAPQTFERELTAADPGQAHTVTVHRSGQGRLYFSTRLRYAPLERTAERVNAGIEIRREYSVQRDGQWVLLESPYRLQRGELVRVDLYLSLPTARHFVVVDDAVPGGLEPVNADLASASTIDAEAGSYQASGGAYWFNFDDWRGFGSSHWSFYHRELRHDAARFFSDYLPAGNYHLSYTAQAVAAGAFGIVPVHTEEMYDPDVFGKGLPAELSVAR